MVAQCFRFELVQPCLAFEKGLFLLADDGDGAFQLALYQPLCFRVGLGNGLPVTTVGKGRNRRSAQHNRSRGPWGNERATMVGGVWRGVLVVRAGRRCRWCGRPRTVGPSCGGQPIDEKARCSEPSSMSGTRTCLVLVDWIWRVQSEQDLPVEHGTPEYVASDDPTTSKTRASAEKAEGSDRHVPREGFPRT